MPIGTGPILVLLAPLIVCGAAPRQEGPPSSQTPAPPEPAAVTQRRQACKGGDGDACNSLGTDFNYGHGVPRDAAAAALYGQACAAGNAVGCNNLGGMYAQGKGVAADMAQAIAFYRRACQGGLPLGCQNLREIPGGDKSAEPPPAPFDGLYRGEIGGRKVLVLIEGTDADAPFWGRYAYLHVGVPIGLDGALQGSAARIEEIAARADEETRAVQWSGSFSAAGFQGEWKSPDGRRRLPIALSLERRAPPSLEDAFHGELAPLNMAPGEGEVAAGDVAYRLVRQTAANVAYPRLARHPAPAVLARVNADLERRHLSSASAALACAPTACRSCEYEEELEVKLFSPEFLSLSVGGVGSCGGPGLFDWSDAVTYDLKTGAVVDLNEEFVIATPEGSLREPFVPLFLKHVGAKDRELQEHLGECYGDPDGAAGYRVVLALTPDGLLVRTDYSRHIEATCEAEAVIRYIELARYRR
jgi:TPR repeat protein